MPYLQSAYMFNRKLRRAAFKRAQSEFKLAIWAKANAELKQTRQEFEDRVAVRAALKTTPLGAPAVQSEAPGFWVDIAQAGSAKIG